MRTELEAIYSIRTDDGINIHVRNRGLVCDGKNADGTSIIDNKIDAITGATMTSNGLDAAIDTWLGAYAAYFGATTAKSEDCCREGDSCEEDMSCCEDKKTEEE